MSLGWKKFEWANLEFKEFDTIEENGSRHYNIDGILLPSMTTILSVLNDGGIDEWKKRVGEEEANRIVSEAINRGNSLHDLSERYLKNTLGPKEVKGPGAVLFNRNRRYLNELQMIVGIEVCLYSLKLGYAGRADCIAFHDGDLCIVDHKNTRRALDLSKGYAKKKIYGYMAQAAGYGIAFAEMFPHLPPPTHGLLIFGNHDKSSSKPYKFPLAPMKKEVEIIARAYYNGTRAEESQFYKL